jgi:hypothetical protein
MKAWTAWLLVAAASGAAAQTIDRMGYFIPKGYEGAEETVWKEEESEPPAFPKQENLVEVYVSAVASNRYFVDASTLAVGNDEVVRYVLVVKTSGGATNVSFEGMRCKNPVWKHYATGGRDGTWTKSRATRIEWRPIENKPVNRHHAALSRDLFCPQGSPIRTAEEGRNALRLGKHPNAT